MNGFRLTAFSAAVLAVTVLPMKPVSASSDAGEGIQVTDWVSLIPEGVDDYEDPFLALKSDELYLLSRIARLRDRGVKATDEGEQGEKLRGLEAEAQEAGLDLDYLWSMRGKITDLRMRAATAANEALAGQRLSLAGFAVPGQPTEDGDPTFYLVPERGMCSHVPPPDPNQMVRITVKPEDVPQYLHQPVMVSGPIETKRSRVQQYVLDGPVLMDASYAMKADAIEFFGQKKQANPVENDAEAGKNFFKQMNEKQGTTTE